MSKKSTKTQAPPKPKAQVAKVKAAKAKVAKPAVAKDHGGMPRDGRGGDPTGRYFERGNGVPPREQAHLNRSGKVNVGGLSKISQDYARALADPKNAPLTGVPTTWPLAQSFKFRAMATGTGAIGTAGYGFVQCSPQRGMANSIAAIYTSGNAYALSTLPATYVETGVSTKSTNSPFAQSTFAATANGNQGRVVGAVLALWYTGTEVNLSGETLALRQPDNEALTGGLSWEVLNAFPTADRNPVTTKRSRVGVLYVPTEAGDVDYNVPNVDPLCMAIMIQGVAGQTFGWEFYGMYEVIGTNIPSATVTGGDPDGFTAVVETAEDVASTFVGSPSSLANQFVSLAGRELRYMSGLVAEGIAGAAVRTLSNYAQRLVDWRRGPHIGAVHYGPRIEELAKKHAGEQPAFEITLADLIAGIAAKKYELTRREPFYSVRRVDESSSDRFKSSKQSSGPVFDLVPKLKAWQLKGEPLREYDTGVFEAFEQ